MEHTLGPELPQTLSLLARMPATLRLLLDGLPDAITHRNEGPDTWSPIEIVAHLIHGERTDWIPRTKMILQSGDSRTFEPFDRLGHVKESQGKSLAGLLEEFERLRSDNLNELRSLNLRADDLARRGRHPAFGPVTLSQLLATWAAHDLTHLHQISRVIAHQFREAVGPWRAYLGVMHCDGHSAPS